MRGILVTFCVLIGSSLISEGKCDICSLPPNSGSCTDSSAAKEESRFYFSAQNLKCTEMPYSGCGGNENNFKSEEECKANCGKKPHESDMVAQIIQARKNSQCWFGNRTYAKGDSMPEITTSLPCSMSCFCGEGYQRAIAPVRPVSIVCAQVDCAPYPSGAGCVPIKKSESDCCSDYYCPGNSESNDTKPAFTCNYNGKEYVEGQIIYPDDYPCITCHCNKNWKGKLTTEGGVCKEVNCGLAIYNQNNLVNKCEPQFYKTSKGKQSCCPIEWKCSNNESN